MAVSRGFFLVLAVATLLLSVAFPAVQAESLAPAPAPTSDGEFRSEFESCYFSASSALVFEQNGKSLRGLPASLLWTSIDQGIAYVLMLVALVLTYLIHAADISYSF
ncbi:hypothetical protein FEM48_Zijuj11G0022900 [Ziziphus jujuba var. spinosa]|uniref:Uncharacterized protein n=1 Tax=Ziziphus jujuba var. spinosa TaxID=714518 RepID=A0A978UG91_ZIZJJ|nr:hypothetical protein FEM48_Zijuj11G0022900 [Ziziphus jujuba var. spinosa]